MSPEQLSIQSIGQVIQFAIGPVVLISGVGLIILSLTNRLGRIVDRARLLVAEAKHADPMRLAQVHSQLLVLRERAHLTRLAVTLAATSVLLVGVLITTLFLAPFVRVGLVRAAILIFIACMGCLIGAMVAFLREVYMSLHALDLEIADV